MPTDYQHGKIYKLFSPSKGLVYYGSTTESLASRLAKHTYRFRNPNKYKGIQNSNKVIECLDYKIELVKDFPCNNRQQLEREEGEYIKANECINRCIAGRTWSEYYADNADKLKEYAKKYREAKKRGETAPHAE